MKEQFGIIIKEEATSQDLAPLVGCYNKDAEEYYTLSEEEILDLIKNGTIDAQTDPELWDYTGGGLVEYRIILNDSENMESVVGKGGFYSWDDGYKLAVIAKRPESWYDDSYYGKWLAIGYINEREIVDHEIYDKLVEAVKENKVSIDEIGVCNNTWISTTWDSNNGQDVEDIFDDIYENDNKERWDEIKLTKETMDEEGFWIEMSVSFDLE